MVVPSRPHEHGLCLLVHLDCALTLILRVTFLAPVTCWRARTMVLAMKCISHAISPLCSACACSIVQRLSHTSKSRHLNHRVYTLVHFPYRSDKSRQGVPVRARHRHRIDHPSVVVAWSSLWMFPFR